MLKRVLLTSTLVCMCSIPVLADTPPSKTPPEHPSKVAPADTYFGRLKLSILGIANTIKDMRLRVEADGDKTPSIFGSLATCEDALHDWQAQYPKDSWIPKNLYNLEVAYLRAQGDKARDMATRTEAWLRHDFPKSPYAAKAHDELVRAVASAPVATAATVPIPAATNATTASNP